MQGLESVVEYLFEAGPTTGDGPLQAGELRNWCEGVGIELEEFEFSTLLKLSRVYLGMLHEARDPACLMPTADKATTVSSVASATNAIMARRPKRK